MTEESTAGVVGLIRDMVCRTLANWQVFALLVTLMGIVNYLLIRDLIEPLRALMEAAVAQDIAAMQEQAPRLGAAMLPRLILLALVFLLAITVWARVLSVGRQGALQGLAGSYLRVLWRSVALLGWSILLAVPYLALYFLLLGLFGLIGLKLDQTGTNLLGAVLALVIYVPLFACYALAVVETAAGRRTPIHQAFDALGRNRVAYFGAAMLLAIAGALVAELSDALLADGRIPTLASLGVAGLINAAVLLLDMSLAAAMRPHSRFASEEAAADA